MIRIESVMDDKPVHYTLFVLQISICRYRRDFQAGFFVQASSRT